MTFIKFRAQTEPLSKNLNMLKLPNLYIAKILKLCFNVFNNNLPDRFKHLLLQLTDGNTHYPFRSKTYFFQFNHEFAKSRIIILSGYNTPNAITDQISTHSLYGFTTCKYWIVIILRIPYWMSSFVVVITYNNTTVYNNLVFITYF